MNTRFIAGVVLGCVLAIMVMFPLFGHGWLLLLDWVNGPRAALRPGAYGLPLPAAPFSFLLRALGMILGPATTGWFLMAAVFPIATGAFARLYPGSLTGTLVGGLLYAVNPFVFERLAVGQVPFLLGYALLPAVLASLIRSRDARGLATATPAIWVTMAAACSIHFVWICMVLVVAVGVFQGGPSRFRWSLVVTAALTAANLYLLLPGWGGSVTRVSISARELQAYHTMADPTFGLIVNVLGLYGFWRVGPRLPKSQAVGWPLLLGAILLVALIGVLRSQRHDRTLVTVCVFSGTAGALLAMGTEGPTGGAYAALYRAVPGFSVMREAEKFSCLLALALAVLFSFGADHLATGVAPRWGRAVVSCVALALPLAYTPTIPAALDGQMSLAHYPSAWYRANALMGSGTGDILFLPWHEYMHFSFARGVIADPAQVFFQRQVISGDNAEVGTISTDSTSPESAFLQRLYSAGPSISNFGALTAPLGVTYVVLGHEVDYGAYSWLYRQTDLRLVMSSPTITVWRNLDALPDGARYEQLSHLRVVAPSADHGSPKGDLPAGPVPTGTITRAVVRRSETRFAVAAGRPGWVVVPVDFSTGWTFNGRRGVALADGATAFADPSGRGGTVSYGPWRYVWICYTISVACLTLITSSSWASRLRRRRSRRHHIASH